MISETTTGVASAVVSIPAAEAALGGELTVPHEAGGLVVFAHGSGSSRHSPRNRFVAGELQRAGLGTLLIDLLTPDEERVDARTGHLRFDIGFLAQRLESAMAWAADGPTTRELGIGCFGASTGAAAALVAAARAPESVKAVVSRGGRPDLAGSFLLCVQAPTLLIVGGNDRTVLNLNRTALEAIPAEKRLEIVPGATHLFEEPGTLEEVALLATDWFAQHLNK